METKKFLKTFLALVYFKLITGYFLDKLLIFIYLPEFAAHISYYKYVHGSNVKQ